MQVTADLNAPAEKLAGLAREMVECHEPRIARMAALWVFPDIGDDRVLGGRLVGRGVGLDRKPGKEEQLGDHPSGLARDGRIAISRRLEN
jgi:hypothetical protein